MKIKGRGGFIRNNICKDAGILASSAMMAVAPMYYSAPTFAAESMALEEVIVTAQKRKQNIQDIPLAVSAFNEDTMIVMNIDDLVGIARLSPSLVIRQSYNAASSTNVSMRGVGTNGTSSAFEGSVGFYIDGVYRSRPAMALSVFNDINRVEVLRGPQGTLFGKNTTAGAITMTSNAPTYDLSYGGYLGAGNEDLLKGNFYINGGVTDTLALRFSAVTQERDGFHSDRYSSEDNGNLNIDAYKLQALWEPSDRLSARLILDYTDSDEKCCFGIMSLQDRENSPSQSDIVPTSVYEELALASGAVPPGADPTISASETFDRKFALNHPSRSEATDQGVALDLTYSYGSVDIRSITSYREWDYATSGDADFSYVDLFSGFQEAYEMESFSQEFNISGSWDNIAKGVEYVFGAFYANEDLQYRNTFGEGRDACVNSGTLWTAALAGQDAANGTSNYLDLISEFGTGAPLECNENLGLGLSTVLGGFGLPEPAIGLLTHLSSTVPWASPGLTLVDSLMTHDDEVGALFSHFTIDLTDEFSAVVGLRYSVEEKTFDRRNMQLVNNPQLSSHEDYINYIYDNSVGFSLFGVNTSGPDITDLTTKDEEWTYNIALQYYPVDNVQFYASYAHGYKSGGMDLRQDLGGGQPALLAEGGVGAALPLTYDPEYVDSYELGLKSSFHDGRGRANVSLFYMDYEDIQFSVFDGIGFFVDNAGEAVSQGLEFEGSYAVSESLISNLAFTYLDAEYGDGVPAPGVNGQELSHAPEWSGIVSFDYDKDITDRLAVYSTLSYQYTGSHRLSFGNDIQQKSYGTTGLQIGLRDAVNSSWRAALWCENCFDEEAVVAPFSAPFVFDNSNMTPLILPRTYGLTLFVDF